MVSVEEVDKYICGYGDDRCSGGGSGCGSYDGDGYGYGERCDGGIGYREGCGGGSSCIESCGYGDGYGDGYGYGENSGCGNCCCTGYGGGYGEADGSGCIDGKGEGCGTRKDYRLIRYNSQMCFEVDDFPCIFLSIKRNIAKIKVINRNDLSTRISYLYKYDNVLAHGKTVRDAFDAAKDKWYLKMSKENKKKELLSLFTKNKVLSGYELFKWHNYITGSCEFGRNLFVRQNNIDLNKDYSLEEFVDICKNDYGGDEIRSLLEK